MFSGKIWNFYILVFSIILDNNLEIIVNLQIIVLGKESLNSDGQ
jgi:hypothetical protein